MSRADATKQRYPNLRGVLMVDTVRGRVRVRAWPKKRGRPKSAAVRDQNAWFKAAVRHLNHVDPGQMKIAIEAAKGTGFYPRDLLMHAASGGMIEIVFPDGKVMTSGRRFLEEKMFQGCTLHKDTKQLLIAGAFATLSWPLPVFDTAGFFDAAANTRITIPPNVSIVSLVGGFRTDNRVTSGSVVLQILKNGSEFLRFQFSYSTWPICGLFSGPRPVLEDDYFEMQVYATNQQETSDNGQTFFSLEVLQVP